MRLEKALAVGREEGRGEGERDEWIKKEGNGMRGSKVGRQKEQWFSY